MITKIDINDIPALSRGSRSVGAVSKDILSFLETGDSAAEITVPKGKTAESVASSYIIDAKRHCHPVRVTKRGQRVFLIRENVHA